MPRSRRSSSISPVTTRAAGSVPSRLWAGRALKSGSRRPPQKARFDGVTGRCYGSRGISLAYRPGEPAKGYVRGLASATPVMALVESSGSARSQSEEAYLRIRDRIVSLDMPPGSVVNEGRLRGELKIGRTPIREALQRLARENLVRSLPHRGTFVTDVNITDLARITEVRVVLESHAARLAAERLSTTDPDSFTPRP